MRIIMHVDMDAFFTSVEQRERPELKGKPVIVGADPKGGEGRGVVSTASYEAREFGVRSGMPISRAWRLCPEGIYLRPNFQLYEKVSKRIMKILLKHAVKFEQVSLDEAFLDLTGKVRDFEEARELADRIKNEIYRKERLTASIGVGPNKLVAKIASDYKKPFGLTIVKPTDVKRFLSPLKVRKLWGVGPKTERKLHGMGIKTIGDLAKADPTVLTEKFGVLGARMHQLANGIDESEVEEYRETKSIGREKTFEVDTDDAELILRTIDELAEEVHRQLLAEKFNFKTVSIKIRYENFETHTHAKTLQFPSDSLKTIRDVARNLIQPFFQTERKIRLIGVRVSGLTSRRSRRTLKEVIVYTKCE